MDTFYESYYNPWDSVAVDTTRINRIATFIRNWLRFFCTMSLPFFCVFKNSPCIFAQKDSPAVRCVHRTIPTGLDPCQSDCLPGLRR
jgi:hypothetical protein